MGGVRGVGVVRVPAYVLNDALHLLWETWLEHCGFFSRSPAGSLRPHTLVA